MCGNGKQISLREASRRTVLVVDDGPVCEQRSDHPVLSCDPNESRNVGQHESLIGPAPLIPANFH